MGVTGLWRLIEPAGKPVPIETLENKVLAVDISIWLHQVVKGYQDARGAPMPNAHLMGLFQRLCKLLYFRIKPVFVFDGGFPELKRETIAKRHDSKTKYNSESERLKRELALLLTKKTAIGSILGNQISPKKPAHSLHPSTDDDIFKLPELPQREVDSESESEDEDTSSGSLIDVHSVDVESETFKTMPLKEKYDLLIELKETRKMNSWGRLHELPKKSDNFSDFQMQRLLKRRKIQECLEKTEKEMGVTSLSLNELESLLNAEGIDTKLESLPTSRIASSDTLRYLLIKDIKQTRAEIENKEKLEKAAENEPCCSKDVENTQKKAKIDELEEDLRKAIQMSLEDVTSDTDPNTINSSQTSDSLDSSYMIDSDFSDSEEDMTLPDMSSAKAYIMQYSDFSNKAIDNIVSCTKLKTKKHKPKTVDEILKELNAEKSVIIDKIELSAGEESKSDTEISANKTHLSLSEQNKLAFVNDSCPNNDHYCSNAEKYTIVDNVQLLSNNEEKYVEIQAVDEQSNSETNRLFIKKSKQIEDLSKQNNSIIVIDSNTSQSSIDLLENKSEVINIDSSIDEKCIETQPEDINKNIPVLDSDSSDDDFEEVVDENDKFVKPVVQLDLDIGTAPEDDIFADIFTKKSEKTSEIEVIEQKVIDIAEKESKIDDIIAEEAKNNSPPNKKVVTEIVELLQEENKDIENIKDKSPVKNIEKHVNENSIINIEPEKEKAIEKIPERPKLSREDLNTMVDNIEKQEAEMIREKSRLDRIGRNITEEMTKDVQELLQIFGIPYVIAPMEAEAQCAFLESIKLTDGTITDDSDIWLFGGRTVYKNFFNQKKHVLQFISDTIERSYNLSREQLILLALLVGSDYTTGVMGVGPVTAMEILASFPYNKKELTVDLPRQIRYTKLLTGLQEFKKWIKAGKKTDNTVLRKKLRNICVGDDFPSTRVVQAYFEPNVDSIKDTFTWGELNITVLRDYTKAKFGWSQNKLDEIIQPVMKRLLERKKQSTLHDYFKRKGSQTLGLEEHMSKRVKAAVHKMLGPESGIEDKDISKDKPKRKRKIANKKGKKNVDESTSVINPEQEENEKEPRLIIKKITQPEIIDSKIEIKVPKLNRYQEIIPQREKEREHLLQNRMKAIEIFRKTNIDKKRVRTKRKVILPKDDAGLSESDSD